MEDNVILSRRGRAFIDKTKNVRVAILTIIIIIIIIIVIIIIIY